MKAKFNLIIDSCIDVPYDTIAWEGVEMLKFPYLEGDKELYDDLFVSRSAHDFYESMRRGSQPKTAQIPYATMLSTFERAINSGIPTVYLAFTSGLSGNYETAKMIRDKLIEEHPDAELYIVDTKLASIAEGLIAYEAIRQRDRGLSARELVEWADQARYYARGTFMVDDLVALGRGGRIPSSVTAMGTKLDVKPLLIIDLSGKLAMNSIARGRKKALRQMAEYYEKYSVDIPGKRVIIGHSDCLKDAERLADLIRKVDETVPVSFANTGPVIGSHVGPGMLSFVCWGRDMRDDLSVADRIALKIKGE